MEKLLPPDLRHFASFVGLHYAAAGAHPAAPRDTLPATHQAQSLLLIIFIQTAAIQLACRLEGQPGDVWGPFESLKSANRARKWA